ncbi:MAG: hypothetical protein ACK55Z_29235, partial [bacterium]
GKRGIYGMLAGFVFGFFNFRTWHMVRFTSFFGIGLGLGMNFMQIKRLYILSTGDQHKIINL